MVNFRGPRIPVRWNGAPTFKLYGYWDSGSGKICMVGSGIRWLNSVNVVLKLDYPSNSSILTSVVNGTLQSLGVEGALDYFKPVLILGLSSMSYNYTLIDRETENGGFRIYDDMENASLRLGMGNKVCSIIRGTGKVELTYADDCSAVNCTFLGGGIEYVPSWMYLNEIECSDSGKVRYLLGFRNSSYGRGWLHIDPNTTLVAEGAWDGKKKRLGLVACRILDSMKSLSKGWVGDCSIRLSLSIPATFSLRNRSVIVGRIWSNRSVNDSGHFGSMVFRSSGNRNPKLERLKYEYTENEYVRKSCTKKITGKGKRGKYPIGSSSDMRFDMIVKNSKGKLAFGYASPLTVGDKFYEPFPIFDSAAQLNHSHGSVLNVSYVMSLRQNPHFKLGRGVPLTKGIEFSTEGIYDAKTGILCMIGCRHLASPNESLRNDLMDCEISVNAKFPPVSSKDARPVKGTIESIRNKLDPLYFERLQFTSTSIYSVRAKESIWRIDLEITMVLISNTLACVFVGAQLLYVKKHQDVLPFISILMLVFLTLAHMIPLLLNFEALFLENRNRQNVFLGSDGWLEVNEVLVRVITMIAFLLQFRLLQQTWSSRIDESHKNLWVSDMKVLYLSLPLYIGGGLIAWFVHLLERPHGRSLLHVDRMIYQKPSFLGEIKSYAGLVLDGFLLPQIVFNLFCNSRERALAPSYYVGTTFVRLLPHAYDLYRAHSSTLSFDYIYANPGMDYYSTAWDIIICCGGMLLVCLLYLQQRFGGRCFLPKRFRESSSYEKVPVLTTE
ncbi:hypothetical protein RJ640_030094 [Escallonia rubra]|uniref:RING-type E3 ubiquitin transferase n=1 Tax=Escallonia rubra TaxID=112253 RepID=A0AA88QKS0_9ASTE|nr:hypothetical protein RJ640_030094 [Escallonia rubra]